MGLGPGGEEDLTPRARRALAEAEVVVGYRAYVELLGPLAEGREILASGMTAEVERCRQAVAAAAAGRSVALVSGGDPGVYGMAGPALEVLAGYGPGAPEVEIVPGITAATAAAAVLGAPLMQDFAVVSLSDRLTPWEEIARRLEAAAAADFVLVLYNPKSRSRPWQLTAARDIILRHRPPATPVGVVRLAGRRGEEKWIADLARLTELPVDMASTVIVGNSQTRVVGSRMITPRGYRL